MRKQILGFLVKEKAIMFHIIALMIWDIIVALKLGELLQDIPMVIMDTKQIILILV